MGKSARISYGNRWYGEEDRKRKADELAANEIVISGGDEAEAAAAPAAAVGGSNVASTVFDLFGRTQVIPHREPGVVSDRVFLDRDRHVSFDLRSRRLYFDA